MLLSFKVKNYRSFKEEQEISFVLKKDEHIEKKRRFEVKTKNGTIRVLKNAVIFGANASGKSNIFKALIDFSNIVLIPSISNVFGLHTDTFGRNGDNTKFEIEFLENESIFKYILEYNSEKVIFESLHQDGEMIFERKLQEFYFKNLENPISDLLKTVRKNTLLLFFAQYNNLPLSKIAYAWFYRFRYGSEKGLLDVLQLDEEFKEKILYALRFSDFNIVDIEIEKNMKEVNDIVIEQNLENIFKNEFGNVRLDKNKQEVVEIYFWHENNGKKFRLRLQNESHGTQKFFNLVLSLLNTNSKIGNVIVYDEFDFSLHEELVRVIIVEMLNNENNRIQFISTSHNSSLMNFLHKHQIYFVEKNTEGESEIFKLSDFEDIKKTRSDSKYATKYKKGLLGAYPVINEAGLTSILGNQND
ncbi:MAG: ATP-binding protein [Defluviitaleaceae bacterium]|nr:ATP-binding protein [Defluviitaleaceae bacterium]